jgi:hypothetical protein
MSKRTRWVIVKDGTGIDGSKPETFSSTSFPNREAAQFHCPDEGCHVEEWNIVAADGIGRDRLAPPDEG